MRCCEVRAAANCSAMDPRVCVKKYCSFWRPRVIFWVANKNKPQTSSLVSTNGACAQLHYFCFHFQLHFKIQLKTSLVEFSKLGFT